jgi:hypothetical protein
MDRTFVNAAITFICFWSFKQSWLRMGENKIRSYPYINCGDRVVFDLFDKCLIKTDAGVSNFFAKVLTK